MKINRLLSAVLIALLALAALGMFSMQALAQAAEPPAPQGEDEGPDVPISGAALEQASAAALTYLGEGRVTATEVGDEEGYYEVEVTLADGRQVDVHLDEQFNVLGSLADGD